MPAPESAPEPRSVAPERAADWEAFYRDYRKPGYVSGFEITSKLGGGMFGLVFRARKQSIGKDYAIKFLQVDDTEVRRAVLAELEQVKWFAQIDHPNLVSIEDRGEVDGIPFLVMSFAGTETLRDRMPANGQPPSREQRDELVNFFLQTCRGLSALHERSLVHFDIKPANVFLKGNVARLGDYGLSKLVTHSRGSLSMGRGTPYYMAPEMLQRRGDARSDIYSLGVMLYEILCGRVPFTGDSEWEVLRAHETKAPELPPHLGALERAVLQRCLQKDPAARFQSVHDLIAAFGSPATAGAAVWADVRDRTAAPRASTPLPSTPPPPPPPVSSAAPPPSRPGEDHLAGLGQASRDAARHAKHVAAQALDKARAAIGRVGDVVQKQTDEVFRGNTPLARKWNKWRQRAFAMRSSRERRGAVRQAARDIVSRRSPIRRGLSVIAAIAIVLFVVPMFLEVRMPTMHFAPSSVSTTSAGPTSSASSAAFSGSIYGSFQVPMGYEDAVSLTEPQWVAVARSDRAAARQSLLGRIEELRSIAPLSADRLAEVEALPSFELSYEHRAAVQRSRDALAGVQSGAEDAAHFAARTGGIDVHTVAAAADLLANGKWETREDVQRAARVHAFLRDATGCRDIPWTDVASNSPRAVARANRHLGQLWTWFTNEFAHTDRTWATYIALIQRR